MTILIAIGYPSETAAATAADRVGRVGAALTIEPEGTALIRRDKEGDFHVETTHRPVGEGAPWGMLLTSLFGFLFFAPCGMAGAEAGLGAAMGGVKKFGLDPEFRNQVHDMLQPGTSALFLVVQNVTPEARTAAFSAFDGTVLESSLIEGWPRASRGARARADDVIGRQRTPGTGRQDVRH